MGEPIFDLDLAGYRLDAIDVAKFIMDLAAWGYQGITMRYVKNLADYEPAFPYRLEFYESDDPAVVIGVVKNFEP